MIDGLKARIKKIEALRKDIDSNLAFFQESNPIICEEILKMTGKPFESTGDPALDYCRGYGQLLAIRQLWDNSRQMLVTDPNYSTATSSNCQDEGLSHSESGLNCQEGLTSL